MTIPLVIDSGAFSAWSKGEVIDLAYYIEFCHEVKETHPHAVFVNLDVIGDGPASYMNWRLMRKEGIDALPIYHMSTPIRWLKKYLKLTNHIGLGALADKAVRVKRQASLDRMWRDFFINKDKMPTVKVHGMGVTSFPLIKRYPWHSVDSTSWLQVGQFGYIYIAKRTARGKWDFTTMPVKVGFSTQCSARKDKNTHYENMTKPERKNLRAYLKHFGFVMGKSKWVKGKRKRKNKDVYTDKVEKIIVKGVSNYHGCRNELSVEFFAAFIKTFPWPRPFTGPTGGLFERGLSNDLCVSDPALKHTMFYLSGSAYRIEEYIAQHPDRLDHLGVLLSYNDLRARGATWKRMEALKSESQSGTTATGSKDGRGRTDQSGAPRTIKCVRIHKI